jgi:hypothetical protein
MKRRSFARVDHAARITAYRQAVAEQLTAEQFARQQKMSIGSLYVWVSDVRRKKRIKLPTLRHPKAPKVKLTRPTMPLTFVMDVGAELALS